MNLHFDKPVSKHHFALRCLPGNNNRQIVEETALKITPVNGQSRTADNFGNIVVNGCINEPHTAFEVEVCGTVRIVSVAYEQTSCGINDRLFLYPTPLTNPSKALTDCLENMTRQSDYDKALHIMHYIHDTMTYMPRSTDIFTTAAQAFEQKKGVCQDYAHIMLTLCRLNNIPARYVVGILNGEGESHAWTEVLCNGQWYGFDPTNNLLVNHEYIKFSHGRDYKDCMICRGIFFGQANQTQTVKAYLKVL
ncbi:MAG: transglutaminase domain-containing protein [Acutalibacteraceae bacterium]